MQKKWFSVYKIADIPHKSGDIKYCVIQSAEILDNNIDEEYDSSGKFVGVEIPFKIEIKYNSNDIFSSYPTSLLITLFRREGTNENYIEIVHGIYNFNKVQDNFALIEGSLIDKYAIIGVSYKYKLIITSNTEVLLKNNNNNAVSHIEAVSNKDVVPGYVDNFYSYPLVLNVEIVNNSNIAKLSWNYPGQGCVTSITSDPSNSGKDKITFSSSDDSSDYKKLLSSSFSEPDFSNLDLKKLKDVAKVSATGLVPRFLDTYTDGNNTVKTFVSFFEVLTRTKSPSSFGDVEEWFFEIQMAKGDLPNGTQTNSNNIIEDSNPDDNSSDYSPSSHDQNFELIYRGKDTKFEYLLPPGSANYTFSGTLMVKWSTRIMRFIDTNKNKFGDPRTTGINLTDVVPIRKAAAIE